MPDLREVYDSVTEQRSPAPGALERQRGRQQRYVRNRKVGTIALSAAVVIAAILVVVLAGTGITDRGGRTNEPAVRPTVSPAPSAFLFDLDTGQRTPVAGIESPGYLSPGIAVSPDGSMVAYAGNDAGGRLVIFVADVDGTNVRPLERTARFGSAVGPEFSPDGSQIVFQVRGPGEAGDIFVVEVATGRTTRVTDLEPASSSLWYMGPHFGPDGRTIYYTLPRTGGDGIGWDLWSVPASGGTPELVLRDAIGGRISPDGRRIVYFEANFPFDKGTMGEMWVADADGSNPRRAVGVQGDVFSARWSPDGTRIAYTDLTAGTAYVVDVSTGEVARALDDVNDAFPEWVNDHTWIVGGD